MTAKTDEPTGVNWNGATTNERERVGIELFSYGGYKSLKR